ncbi:MAG: hypothetical protein ACLT9S_02095 [Faecalibacterium sp.]
MLIPVLLFIVGLLCLIKGGDWFVDGATGIARRFHVPELLIGATVVSIGTTLPEVMVSTTSALTGHGEIAYGNAIGSVICNVCTRSPPSPLRCARARLTPRACAPRWPSSLWLPLSMPVWPTPPAASPARWASILLAMFVAYIVCNVLAMKNTPAPEEGGAG